jgi:hypothetical protein
MGAQTRRDTVIACVWGLRGCVDACCWACTPQKERAVPRDSTYSMSIVENLPPCRPSAYTEGTTVNSASSLATVLATTPSLGAAPRRPTYAAADACMSPVAHAVA